MSCIMDDKLKKLVSELSTKLGDTAPGEGVFNAEDRRIISETKTILDLPGLAFRLHTLNTEVEAEAHKFINAITAIPISSAQQFDTDILTQQFQVYTERLLHITRNIDSDELGIYDAKIIIKNFLKSNSEFYKGIENIMHVIACAAVKNNCESIVESFFIQI